MLELSHAERNYLRRQAHTLKPIVQIGKYGLTDSARMAVDTALDDHELIKVKLLAAQDDKRTMIDDLAATTDSNLISLIGNIATLYRRQPDPDRRKIELPE
jgi:RNA-binding protein